MAYWGSPIPLSPFPTTIDLTGQKSEQDQIAARAAAENDAIIQQAQKAQDEADAKAARDAAAANQAILDQENARQAAAADNSPAAYMRSAAHGALTGVFGLADLPERAYTGIKNFPARLENAGIIGSGIEPNKIPLANPSTPVTDRWLRTNPTLPGWENSWTELGGQIAGPAVVLGPLAELGAGSAAAAAGAAAPLEGSLVRSLITRPLTTAGAAAAGSAAGGALAPKLADVFQSAVNQYAPGLGKPAGDFSGDNPDLADLLSTYGSLGGGMAGGAATAARSIIFNRLNRAYTNASSEDRYNAWRQMYDDARARAIAAGNEPPPNPISLAAFGNKAAQVREDATVGIPMTGTRAYDARYGQYTLMAQNARDIANDARVAGGGQPIVPGGPARDITIGTLGRDSTAVANEADRAIQAEVDRVFGQGLSDRVGRDTALDVNAQRQTLDTLRNSPLTSASQQPTILEAQRNLAANSTHVVDQARENMLQGQLAAARAQVPPNPAAIDAVERMIAANRGPTWQQELTERAATRHGDTNIPLNVPMQRNIVDAKTNTLRQAAARAGIPPEEFDAIHAQTAALKAQQEELRPLTGGPGLGPDPREGQAATAAFGSGGQHNLGQIEALATHAPASYSRLLADEFERRVLGNASAGQPNVNPETFSPQDASTWLDAQERGVRDVLAPTPEDQARLEALSTVMRGEQGRPSRTLPGKGGNTLGAPATLYQNPAFLLSLGSLLAHAATTGAPLTSIGSGLAGLYGALQPMIKARLVSRLFTNPNFYESVLHPPPPTNMGRAVTGALISPPAQGR